MKDLPGISKGYKGPFDNDLVKEQQKRILSDLKELDTLAGDEEESKDKAESAKKKKEEVSDQWSY